MKAAVMEHRRGMKEQNQKRAEDSKAQDAQLIQRPAEMNRAPSEGKIDLTASIVTQTVERRVAMGAEGEDGKESMAECPMRKVQPDMGKANTEQKQLTGNPR